VITTLRIDGMTCNGCVKHVGEALRALPGVAAVDVQLAENRARVDHDPDRAPITALVAAVDQAGYTAVPNDSK
jgi:copper chaperone CopZ